MYGLDYMSAGAYNIIVVIVAFVVMFIGSITDLQKREVADWINYGLFFGAIGLRLLYSAITLNPMVLLDGFAGFVIFTIFGLGMFYLGQWGGGDAKMIIGLGTLFGLKIIPLSLYNIIDGMLVAFLINSLLAGAVYGLAWSGLAVYRNRVKFMKNWIKINKKHNKYKIASWIVGLILLIAGFVFMQASFLFVPLGVMVIVLFYSYLFTKSVEKGCMVFQMPISELTEGEWIEKDVKVKGKYICGPKDLGISKKQIALLKRLKVKKIAVKIGIPFVPSFFLGFILTFFFGNLFLEFVRAVLVYM